MDYHNLRVSIEALLSDWDRGKLNAEQVLDKAEDLWDPLDDHDVDLPDHHPYATTIEVLRRLERLNHHLIIRDDIPVMKEFLRIENRAYRFRWKAWHDYWDTIDYRLRSEQLRENTLYFVDLVDDD